MSAKTGLNGNGNGGERNRNGLYRVDDVVHAAAEGYGELSGRLQQMVQRRLAVAIEARCGDRQVFVGAAMPASKTLDKVVMLYINNEADVVSPGKDNEQGSSDEGTASLTVEVEDIGDVLEAVEALQSGAGQAKRNFRFLFLPGPKPKRLVFDVPDLEDMQAIRAQVLKEVPHDDEGWRSTDDGAYEPEVTAALSQALAIAPELRAAGDSFRQRVGQLAITGMDQILEAEVDGA